MPDLGPSPAPDVLSEDQVEQLPLEQQDADWQQVTAGFPEAERPAVPFDGYSSDGHYLDALDACYLSSGLNLETKVNEVGDSESSGAQVTSASDAVARFACGASVVLRPSRGTTPRSGTTTTT